MIQERRFLQRLKYLMSLRIRKYIGALPFFRTAAGNGQDGRAPSPSGHPNDSLCHPAAMRTEMAVTT